MTIYNDIDQIDRFGGERLQDRQVVAEVDGMGGHKLIVIESEME